MFISALVKEMQTTTKQIERNGGDLDRTSGMKLGEIHSKREIGNPIARSEIHSKHTGGGVGRMFRAIWVIGPR